MCRKHLLGLAPLLLVLANQPARADNPVELNSYALMADEFVTRDKGAADAIFFAADVEAMAAKMKEFGVEYPRNFTLHGDSVLVLVVSDHVEQAFAGMSMLKSKRQMIVDLSKDTEKKPPGDAPEGKKNSRLLLIGCPGVGKIGGWAMHTTDGKRQEVRGTELLKKH